MSHTHGSLRLDMDSAPMKRRTLVTGAAWSIPVVAGATTSPMAAASPPCPQFQSAASWQASTSGQLRTHPDPTYNNRVGGTYLPLPVSNTNSFLSVQDRNVANGITTVQWSTVLVPVSGTAYTFTFVTNTSTALTDPQTLNLRINGTTRWEGITKPAAGGPTNLLSGVQTHTFTWVAPSNAAVTFAIVFLVPGVTPNPNRTNDDIRIGLPRISAAGCRS